MENKFELGRLVTTNGVHNFMEENIDNELYLIDCFTRYIKCDWGSMCDEDKEMNDLAVANGNDRIFASYEKEGMPKLWIITEWDRSYTTILFPSEY